MNNVIDYVTWRGDLTIEDSPLNNIDFLILSAISYFPIELVINHPKEVFNLRYVYERMIEQEVKTTDFLLVNDVDFLKKLAMSKRFGKLKIDNFVCKRNLANEEQFAAMTIHLPRNQLFVSYRGTDHSFVGWKEDFNMTYMEVVPAQKTASDYLNHLKTSLFSKIYLGGHSKGGNLAIYAAMNCYPYIQHKVKKIFNYDGPGFLKNVVNSKAYQEIEDRIFTYIPQTSIIGRLLNVNEKYNVIKSNQKFVLQHDFYSWEIYPTDFVYFDDLDEHSKLFDEIISGWLETISFEEREQFINIIYKTLLTTNVSTFEELNLKGFKGVKKVYNLIENIHKEDRKVVDKVVRNFFKVVKDNLLSSKNK